MERWAFHTTPEPFLTGFQAIISASKLSIDDMVEQVEGFLMVEAQKAGVVRLQRPFKPHNPNQLTKSLAPWFNPACKSATDVYRQYLRSYGKSSEWTRAAFRKFQSACAKARAEFAEQLPDLVKYKPKQFWYIIKQKDPALCP